MFKLIKVIFSLFMLAMFACSLSLVWDDSVRRDARGAVSADASSLYMPQSNERP